MKISFTDIFVNYSISVEQNRLFYLSIRHENYSVLKW
jgi:hypothetical protein